jgi:putative membrane protein
MAYFYIKALHIVFVVSWFSGLFYMVRFFVYHSEALAAKEPKRTILHEEYMKNEKLLYQVITTPAMVLTLFTGLAMIHLNPSLLQATWFLIKLCFLVGLLAYHFHCGYVRQQFKKEISIWTSIQFRMWNEVATLFLVAIVFIVTLKHNLNWIWGTLGFIAFAIIIMLIVKLVKHFKN